MPLNSLRGRQSHGVAPSPWVFLGVTSVSGLGRDLCGTRLGDPDFLEMRSDPPEAILQVVVLLC